MNGIRFLQYLIIFLLSFAQAHAESLLQQAQDNIALGYYREAEQQLQQLASSAQSDDYTTTAVQGLQGMLALQKQQYTNAKQLLEAAKTQAQQHAWHDLTVRFALYLGELHQQQQELKRAQADFSQAIAQAQALDNKPLLASSLIHAAKLAIENKQLDDAWGKLQQTNKLLEQLPVSTTSSQLWLNAGYQLQQIYMLSRAEKSSEKYLAAAFYNLNKALNQGKETQQLRVQVSALKHLAALYQKQDRVPEAIKLLQEAVHLAQQDNAEDSLVELEWYLGRLYKAEKQPSLAITSYKNALQHLENIRLDIPVTYENGKSSFKRTFSPLYLGLADLLLQQAPLKDKNQQQVLLHEAQNTIELIKKAELDDYFQSRCSVSEAPLDLKKTDPSAAAIYPILLDNRTEIIVYTADGLHQFTQPIGRDVVNKQARLFAKQLRDYAKFSKTKPQAEFLYQTLIKPILPLLQKKQIKTLIYIPDGSLRSFPLSALYDGQRFLIEDYAIVNSPGMSLIAKNNDEHTDEAILFAGMSMPGDVVNELPDSLLVPLISMVETKEEEKKQVSRYLEQWVATEQKRELTSEEQKQKTQALHQLLENSTVTRGIQQKLALPGVEAEIKQLAQQTGMPYWLNEDFSLEKFSIMLTAQPYKVLHLASHGFFGATTEESFVMTYDKILSMNKLEALLSTPHFKKYPLDLIILSACQTAEGDDRSPLGISGIAIKSKVHSAVGSLWPVSDTATSQLMQNLYAGMKKSHFGKAKALQEAEVNLLKQKKFANPALWSPFILVGDWL